MSSVDEASRFAPPQAHVEDVEAGGSPLELATQGMRPGADTIGTAP